MPVDLHTHSNCSDGSLSPLELVKYAKHFGVTAMALTDHDTVAGLAEAQKAGAEQGLDVLSGVELSIDYLLPGKAHLHLVGLLIDWRNEALVAALDELKEARDQRAQEIIGKMQQAGLQISYDELLELAGDGSLGRPHLATLMVRKGFVSSMKKAFQQYLGKGCPFYVPKKKLNLRQAIDAIHQAGGLAILAHPYSLGFKTYPPLGEEILKLKELGLDGIEAYYSGHDRYFTKWLLDFAHSNDLLVSGGSDFHGKPKPGIKPGVGYGDLKIPEEVVLKIKEYWRKKYLEKQ